MNKKILECIETLDIENIAAERKLLLQELINYIQDKRNENHLVNLNFICTHNSRRSHLAQIWAQVAAAHFGIDKINCYSGGTEATAMFPMIRKTLESQGFGIQALSKGNNPIYAVKYDADKMPIIAFSKTYDHSFNPESEFAALMTCDSADQNCPFIPGAEKRIAITYEDPKAFDGTGQQEAKYLERSEQIANEMKYVFSQIN